MWLRTFKISCISCSWRSLTFYESNSGIPRILISSVIGSILGGSFGGGLSTLNITFSHSSFTVFWFQKLHFPVIWNFVLFSAFNSLTCILHSVSLASSLDWTHLLQSRSALLPNSLIPSMATCDKNVQFVVKLIFTGETSEQSVTWVERFFTSGAYLKITCRSKFRSGYSYMFIYSHLR